MSLVPMLFRDETGKVIAMQVPKAFYCASEQNAKLFAKTMGRPVIVEYEVEVSPGMGETRIGRMHPSGRFEDLKEQFALVRQILNGEVRGQGSFFTDGVKDAKSKNDSKSK